MSDRELLKDFFSWLVDNGIAAEGYNPDNLATNYLMDKAAKRINANIKAHEDEDARIKRETTEQAHREAERDLERIGRANSGFPEARR